VAGQVARRTEGAGPSGPHFDLERRIIVMLTFVLGGRLEGAAELSLSASARAIPVASLMGRELRADSESL